jgi:hypothetical protein
MEALQTDYRRTQDALPAPADPRENILACLKRGLPEFQPAFFRHDGTFVVCGSGPSLPSFIDEMRDERKKRRPICAAKGAHDLLCENGIEPDIFVSVEAKPRLDNVKHKNQHTLYLISSRCSPELFDWLSDCKVLTFHSYSDKEAVIPELSGQQLIGGGNDLGAARGVARLSDGVRQVRAVRLRFVPVSRQAQALQLGTDAPRADRRSHHSRAALSLQRRDGAAGRRVPGVLPNVPRRDLRRLLERRRLDHFDQQLYQRMLQYADYVTCPTEAMKARIAHPDVTVILDPYEFDEEAPHCNGNKVLWFGHGTNFKTLIPLLPQIFAPLTVVSNIPLAMPWSLETMVEQFALNDIVILPATADYKSPNRAVEAIRQGCFVVAEPHPALTDFPGIWIGDIPKGIEWASQNPLQANAWTRRAQKWVKEKYSPRIQADAWKSLFTRAKSRSTSEAAASTGRAGSESMTVAQPT